MKLVSKMTALAIAAASCAGAQAAHVELFGFLDAGVSYINERTNEGMAAPVGQRTANVVDKNGYVARKAKRQTFEQGTGNVSTFGFRGKEELNEDVSVIFHLEQGFLADTGEMYNKNKMFERESTVGLLSKTYGEFKVGRMPGLLTGSGTTGKLNGRVNPFGAGWGNMTGGYKFVSGLQVVRLDNMFYYATPNMGGFNGYLQGSFGNTDDGSKENTSKSDRYLAALVSYSNGPLFAALGADWMNSTSSPTRTQKDWYRVYAGAHYDFSGWTLYGTAHYMKNVKFIGGYSTKEFAPLANGANAAKDLNRGFEGYAVTTGAKFSLWSGTVMASLGYGWGEDQNLSQQNKYKRANVGLGYRYPLSKRTSLYGIAGYFWQDADWQKKNIYANELILGLMHRF